MIENVVKISNPMTNLHANRQDYNNKPLNKLVEAGREGGHFVHDEKKAAVM